MTLKLKSILAALVAPALLHVFAAAISILPATATAQAWPDHSVRIIVPYPTGGGTDTLTRLVGRYLGDSLKQPIVVENRAGAMAQIGMDLIKRAPADGYNLLAIAAGPLNEGNMADFQPISLFAAPSYILVVHPEVKASNVSELVALAKANPGKLAYGSTGGGAASHLATELFKSMANVDMLHVPYKGVGAAVSDLLGGHVQVMLAPPQAVIPHVKAGSLRALGVTGPEPMALLPEVQPISKSGVPGYEAVGWFGLIARAGTPPEVITRLNDEISRILVLPEMQERLRELGAEPAKTTPDQFASFIRQDNAKWAKLIKEKGIVVEGAK
jgi:tripartite-type tricarboxylate transporter receptor subunit TctC